MRCSLVIMTAVVALAFAQSACTRREAEQPCDLPDPPPSCPARADQPAPQRPMQAGAGTFVCAFGNGPLADGARAAAERALADERRAEGLYDAAVSALGAAP